MSGASAFTVYTVLAVFLLYLMQYTGDRLDAVFVRAAAGLFMAAGFVGAAGAIGRGLEKAFVQTNATGDAVARTAVGSVIMWLVWFCLAVMWFLCMLPERWFGKAIPDWLSVGGLVIPAGLRTVPDPAGRTLTDAARTISDFVATPFTALFGG